MMKTVSRYLCLICLVSFAQACSHGVEVKNDEPPMTPEWTKTAIWYQIFVERFNNGDLTNDPSRETIRTSSDFVSAPDDWAVTPWTRDWYEEDTWAKNLPGDFYSHLQLRRYGGDLQGVMNKIDHLADLGINAIYFNPLNDAPSLHKYDARNYHHIDVNFGPDPKGDMAIIASENPADPTTWKWTSADRLFLQLVEALHAKGIKVIMDYSWNHTGVEFWAWRDIMKNQQESPYKDWYEINSFDDPATDQSEFSYKGWLNIQSLPELKKVDATPGHQPGFPYQGNLFPATKEHIFAVAKRWLAPNGDPNKGIDGFRLDVADHVPMGFWKEYYQWVKDIKPEAYLVGEIWWQEWPDKLMNPVPYVTEGVFDAVMFYQVYRPARYFFAKTDYEITADQLKDSLNYQWNRLSSDTRNAMMNTASTHDTPRLLSSFANRNKYKHNAKPNDDAAYFTGKPDAETYQRVRLYLIHQFTIPGAPHIWNGEELGMWGADDPDCRKPLWWPEFQFEAERRNNIQPGEPAFDAIGYDAGTHSLYKQLIAIRKAHTVLSKGEIQFLKTEGKTLVYSRQDANEHIIAAFNLAENEDSYQLEAGKTYTDLLTGQSNSGRITLSPMAALVLLENK